MKKMYVWMMAAILVCGESVFTACTVDNADNPAQSGLNVAEKIVGKWITADYYNQPMLTNEKATMDIVSTTKAYVSASFSHNPAVGTAWFNMLETDVTIDGNKMTQTQQSDEHTRTVNEFTIASISASEFTAYLKFMIMVDGSVVHTKEYSVRYIKMAADYSQSIVGKWQGRSTGAEGSEFDDGEDHRWEYLADGTFHYYHKVDGQWMLSDDEYANYFVDGTLLCTRWKNAGEDQEEHREWWEIESIEDGVMKWTALRQREDGSTYTATFEMIMVQ